VTDTPIQERGLNGDGKVDTARSSPRGKAKTLLQRGATFDRYTVLEMLGRGGMGEVYAAYDSKLDRKVALKVLRLATEDLEVRLQREAQAMARLSHPNVVAVFDTASVDGRVCVAMEFVEGVNLRAWQRAKERSWAEILRMYLDAGRGLAAAHAAGLVHRDFKPDNVMVSEAGAVKVTDFGVARAVNGPTDTPLTPSGHVVTLPSYKSTPPTPPTGAFEPSSTVTPHAMPESHPSLDVAVTQTGELLGTPGYMAPEQYLGDAIDERTDQFAFCVSLYEALYGHKPFPAGMTEAVNAMLAGQVRPPPKSSKVPAHVRRALLRGLANNKSDRHPRMLALLNELSRDPARRRRQVAGVVAAVAALALGAVWVNRTLAERTSQLCAGGRARVEAVWGPPKRDAVREAFARTGLPYASDAAASVTRLLDDYAARIARESDEACAATRLQGSQSEEVMDLRIACYGGRLREVGAFVDILAHPDPETVQQATKGAAALSTLDDCSDVSALRATAPRPRDPATIARIDTLEQRLAVAKATRDLGKSAEAAKIAEELLPDAKDVRFVPLVARVNLWRGRAYGDLHLTSKAVPALRDAFAAALESNEERVLKDSAMSLALQYILLRDQDSFDWWAEATQSSIQRGGPDAEAQRALDFTRCRAFYIAGRPLARLACLEEYRARVEPLRPLDSMELNMLGIAAVDAGAFAHALDYASRATDESLRQNGPHHPRSLLLRMHRCRAAISYGDSAAAIADCRGTLKTLQGFTAKDAPYLVRSAEILVARALIDGNQLDEGRAILERLAAPDEASSVFAPSGDEQDLEDARAQLDLKTGHVDRALRHFRSALAVALKGAPSGSSVDPDVVLTKLALGKALLAHGDVLEARAVLDDALAASARAEIAPTVRTELGFADARALWEVDRSSRPRAWALAKEARDAFDHEGPKTSVYDEMRAGMNEWLARHEERIP
jgi:predicted Ser/Thr protein kinase